MLAGYLCAIAATIFWSGNFIVARELNDLARGVLIVSGIVMANHEKKANE